MTRSEDLVAKVRRDCGPSIHESIVELIAEYEIAIAQNLALETAIHALCKRIDELPCPE